MDEILAVGDEAFQRKSRQRMLELMGGGTTVAVRISQPGPDSGDVRPGAVAGSRTDQDAW